MCPCLEGIDTTPFKGVLRLHEKRIDLHSSIQIEAAHILNAIHVDHGVLRPVDLRCRIHGVDATLKFIQFVRINKVGFV